jgi:hypothetical protein
VKSISSVAMVASLLLVCTSASTSQAAPEPSTVGASGEEVESGPSPERRALAEALFREGKALGEAGHVTEACNKFKESQRLDPALGTLLHLATCYAEEGKTASAWATFSAAADQAQRANQKERELLARERASQLEAQLSRLVISIAKPVEDMSVELDRAALGESALSTALPVDPGPHMLTVTAPGKRSWTKQFQIPPGPVTETIAVPALEDAPIGPPPQPPETKPVVEERGLRIDQRTIGLVVGGVGIASIGAGSVFGLLAASQANEADKYCQGQICSQRGLDRHESARTSATIANVFFAVGIAGVAAGTYLVLTSGSADSPGPTSLWVGASVGRLSAGGSF